jgi:hypothetical protein
MMWDDDLTLETADLRRGQLQLAMYAQHLSTGSTLFCRQIRAKTIKLYVKNVAAALALFGPLERDFRKENPTETGLCPTLNAIFKEMERWEQMPNRREPFTIEMLDELLAQVKVNQESFLSKNAAMTDWLLIGLFTGSRLTEWAQEAYINDPDSPKCNLYGDTAAFCLPDVRAQTISGAMLFGATILSVPCEHIAKFWIRWRTQKNGENGEEKLYVRNRIKGGRNLITPMYNVLRRFVTLRGVTDTTTPLALYADSAQKRLYLITAADIENSMRTVAAKLFKLDPSKAADKKKLQLWSAHSLRVGACVILHGLGFTESQIKHLLRWKSNAFMAYLRNLSGLAEQQNQALDTAGAMPHFI